MEEETLSSGVTMHVTRGCLVVPIQVELYDETIVQIQQGILERIKETAVKGVIIDLSGVSIIDSFLAQAIFDAAKMTSMLGATTILTGIRPPVAASLIDLEVDLKDVETAITLEEGFQRLKPLVEPEEKLEEIEEEAGEDIIPEETEDSEDETEDLEESEEELPEQELEDEE